MKLNNKGFSLVELMVVVAIIGILASVAVPSINKYMAKARQSEAKTNLGSLYTAEKAFAAEYTLFHSAFQAVGFSPEGRMRYNIGFSGAGTSAGVPQGYQIPTGVNLALISTATYCGAIVPIVCSVLVGANGAVVPPVPGTAGGVATLTAAGPAFTAAAISVLVTGAQDIWTMSNLKILNNTQNGIL